LNAGARPADRHAALRGRGHAEILRHRDAQQPSQLFCEQLLECVDFEIALGKEPLEPRVLVFEFFEPLNLSNRHAAVLLAPAIKGRLGNAVFAADGADGLLTFSACCKILMICSGEN
jgi:hypothetical protein